MTRIAATLITLLAFCPPCFGAELKLVLSPEEAAVVSHGKHRFVNGQPPEELPLSAEVLLSNADVESVKIGRGPNGSSPSIQISLTERGGTKLFDVTSRYTGRELAVVSNGEILFAHRVSGPMSQKVFFIEDPNMDTDEKALGFLRDLGLKPTG